MSTLVFSTSIYGHISLRKPRNPTRRPKPKNIKKHALIIKEIPKPKNIETQLISKRKPKV